jgi:hypothetical protein
VHRARRVVFASILAFTFAAMAEQQLSDPARHAIDVRLAATSEHALLVWRYLRPNTEVTGVLLNNRGERIGEPFTIASGSHLREAAVAASDRDYLVVWQDFAARRLEAAIVVDPAAPHQDRVTLSSSLQILNFGGNDVYAVSPPPRVIWNGRQYVVFWMAADGLLHAATLDRQLKIDREVALPFDSPPLAVASQQLGDVMIAVAHSAEDRVTLSAAILSDRLEIQGFQTIATATPVLQPAYAGSALSWAAAVSSEGGYVVSWIRKQNGGDTIEITATTATGTPLDTAVGADGNVYGKVVGRADTEAYGLHLQRSAGRLSASWYRRDAESFRHYDVPHRGGFVVWLDASTLQPLHAQAKVLPPIEAVAVVAIGDATIVAYIPRGNVIDYHYPDSTVYATVLNYTPPRRRAVRSHQ